MPKLNLTKEDIASIDIESLMTEQTIVSLLRYHVDDEDNVAVHIGNLPDVFAAIIDDNGRALTLAEESQPLSERTAWPSRRKEHLVILKLICTIKESEKSYEHYVGLRIRASIRPGDLESSCLITYLDPMGNSIDEDIKTEIDKVLKEVFSAISPDWGTPCTTSYDHLTGEEFYENHCCNERYIQVSFSSDIYKGRIQSDNSLNSGLFLIYLLVCLERNIPFISLEHVLDQGGSSKKIAVELKQQYLAEYEKDKSDNGEPRNLAKLQLSKLIGPTNYQHDANPFRWQIQEQQEYFLDLLNKAHEVGRDKFLEIGSLINKRIALLTREGNISAIWEAIINQLEAWSNEEVVRVIDNDLTYDAYTRYIDNKNERRDVIQQRREEEFDIDHGGLNGPDRDFMRIEEGLDSEDGSESERSSSSSQSSENNSSYSRESNSNSDGSESEVDDRFNKEYSEGWLGECEKYIDGKFSNVRHRYWARNELEALYSGDLKILLSNLFSMSAVGSMIYQAIKNSDIVNILFEGMSFESFDFGVEFNEIFRNSDYKINNIISQADFILLIESIINPVFSGTSQNYRAFLDNFSEQFKKPLLFKSQNLRIDFIEGLYDKAAARNDLIEMQAIWSVYSKMRKELIENVEKGTTHADIQNSIQESIFQHTKYVMRFYPHKSVSVLTDRDKKGEEIKYDLLQSVSPLASLARDIKTKVSSKSKLANIFIPKLVFSVEEIQNQTRKKFITIELDLDYVSRLLSRNAKDGVMIESEDVKNKKQSKADSLKGARLIGLSDEEIKEIDDAGDVQFQCSERVFIEILRKKQTIQDIVKLLNKEIMLKFDTKVLISDSKFLIDSITFLGFSSQSPCKLCAPALIWLQNSFSNDEPIGMLIQAINNNSIHLNTRGYNIDEQTQDYSQIEINTIIYSDMNSNAQSDDMADKLSHRHCQDPQKVPTYNPKAKLILPKKAIDLSKPYVKKIEKDGVSMYIKPYIIEYCSVIDSELKNVQDFPGIACISGGKSENNNMKDLFGAHNSLKQGDTVLKTSDNNYCNSTPSSSKGSVIDNILPVETESDMLVIQDRMVALNSIEFDELYVMMSYVVALSGAEGVMPIF